MILPEEIEKAARVIKISLSAPEKENLVKDAVRFMDWVKPLLEVDTGHVEPTFLPFAGANVQRVGDRPSSANRGNVVAAAANFTDGFYEVPSIIEE